MQVFLGLWPFVQWPVKVTTVLNEQYLSLSLEFPPSQLSCSHIIMIWALSAWLVIRMQQKIKDMISSVPCWLLTSQQEVGSWNHAGYLLNDPHGTCLILVTWTARIATAGWHTEVTLCFVLYDCCLMMAIAVLIAIVNWGVQYI